MPSFQCSYNDSGPHVSGCQIFHRPTKRDLSPCARPCHPCFSHRKGLSEADAEAHSQWSYLQTAFTDWQWSLRQDCDSVQGCSSVRCTVRRRCAYLTKAPCHLRNSDRTLIKARSRHLIYSTSTSPISIHKEVLPSKGIKGDLPPSWCNAIYASPVSLMVTSAAGVEY